MSLPEDSTAPARRARPVVLAAVAAFALAASACTVRPLYSDTPHSPAVNAGVQAELASISVKPVSTRYAQQVRNHLIFAFTGGGVRTATPLYSLDLDVSEQLEAAASVQVATNVDQPTAGTVRLTSAYRLTDIKTGELIAQGRRTMSASYDKPRQEFASYRAQRDAEDRAARELAQMLNLAIAQDLAKR